MKKSVYLSCTFLYFIFNQVQVSNSEPISLAILGAVSGLITIIAYIELRIEKATPAPMPVIVQPDVKSEFWHNLEILDVARQQISLSEEIKLMVGEIPTKHELWTLTFEVQQIIKNIDTEYKYMLGYKKMKAQGTELTKLDINNYDSAANTNIAGRVDSPYDRMKKLYGHVIGDRGYNIVEVLYKLKAQNIFTTCSTGEELGSFQQNLEKLLTRVFVSCVKSYLTIRFSADFKQQYKPDENGTNSTTLAKTYKGVEEVMNMTSTAFKREMERASRDVWLCDPGMHTEGVTFDTMRGTFHTQIMPQYFLDNDRECKVPCSVINDSYRKIPTWKWNPSPITEKDFIYEVMPSFRQLFNCKDVGTMLGVRGEYDAEIMYRDYFDNRTYGLTLYKYRQFSGLRISTDETRNYGFHDGWIPKDKFPVYTYTQKRHMKGNNFCHTCACTADESLITFSLYPMIADKNHVITGARISRCSFRYYIQIQQGKLLPHGAIDKSSIDWKPVNQTKLRESTSDQISYDFRSIYMHDIDLPPNHVMVGVGFDVRDGFITLKVTGRTFNFTSGKINYDNIRYNGATEYTADGGRSFGVLEPEDLNVPKQGVASTRLATNVVVNFTTNNFRDDLGQETVPFLDIQNVTTTDPTPMSGAGLYYKYREQYAGYIGIKLKTYDFLYHVNNNDYNSDEVAKSVAESLLNGNI